MYQLSKDKLLAVMADRNASGLKELAALLGTTTDEVKRVACELRDEGRLGVTKRYDSTWRITYPEPRRVIEPEPESESEADSDEDEELSGYIDANQMSNGDLLRVMAELQDEMDIVQGVLRSREVL